MLYSYHADCPTEVVFKFQTIFLLLLVVWQTLQTQSCEQIHNHVKHHKYVNRFTPPDRIHYLTFQQNCITGKHVVILLHL